MRRLLPALGVLASYAVVLALLAWPWLRAADRAIPVGDADPGDSRLLAYQLAWVARALADDPARILDAPIFHPAPRQLTGSEGFFSTAIAFAPLHWWTGNATLAASLTAFLSYPLAALAMNRLVLALGCGGLPAWVAGLAFALGPLRVPANLMTFHYVNLWLPLVALASLRLRERPTPGRAALLSLALAMGLASGFYMAVMLLWAAALWLALEALRPEPGRARFVALWAVATAVALCVLGVVALPWLGRREAAFDDPLGAMATERGMQFVVGIAGVVLRKAGWLEWGLALPGLVALASSTPGARRAAAAGALCAAVGVVLMLGRSARVGGVDIPLPFELLALSPARFFRVPWRFVVLAGFGSALLTAAGLELVRRRTRPGLGIAVCVAAAVAIVAVRGRHLAGDGLDPIAAQHAPVYDDVRRAAAQHGAGPLLELPVKSTSGLAQPEAMLGSLRHGLPLVHAHTGYRPAHSALVQARISELPRGGGLEDLVDMTHLRWILLRPREEWLEPQARDRIAARHDLEHVLSRDGFELLRVPREPAHPEWYAAIARGGERGTSILGTPFAPLAAPAGGVRARVQPERVAPGQHFLLLADVHNAGDAPWPAAAGRDDPMPLGVKLSVRLAAESGDERAGRSTTVNLWRDVPAGESLAMAVPIVAPATPGRYRVEVGLVQPAGAAFRDAAPAAPAPVLEVVAP